MIQPAPTILIVDDIPENISTLFDFLDTHDFEVLVARDGETAIELIEYEMPDLILLDVMMTGINGFETCQRLKANTKTQNIPIIFMTALSNTYDKVKGFNLGAVDYVTKPIQQEEVLARINTHLTICHLQQQLQTKNTELKTKNIELATKNTELEVKNAELDAFSYMVAHDLKNPLSHLISMSDILLEEFSDDISSYASQCVQHIFQSSEKMIGIVNALLLLASVSKQDVELIPLDMGDIIYQVQQRLTSMLKKYQGEVIIPEKWPIIEGYAPWIEEIWVNYLSNGLKYGGQPPRLEIGATPEGNMIRFWIRDNGDGLSQEAIAKLFTPFTRLHQTSEEGHGLGLSIVQRIVEKLGGKVGVESQPGNGSVFYFTLNKSTLEIAGL
ncbi:response regulator [Candidatus Parabeggiatoa sp. HSG14]|uniref:response regulator n=1 Tax=Candidatus Parabeggiatoa sp. HSG14 TaxID=3055593 RepID=UPI0025A8D085|nr:response regulator [Thiotrichales bacterium HSG14]